MYIRRDHMPLTQDIMFWMVLWLLWDSSIEQSHSCFVEVPSPLTFPFHEECLLSMCLRAPTTSTLSKIAFTEISYWSWSIPEHMLRKKVHTKKTMEERFNIIKALIALNNIQNTYSAQKTPREKWVSMEYYYSIIVHIVIKTMCLFLRGSLNLGSEVHFYGTHFSWNGNK